MISFKKDRANFIILYLFLLINFLGTMLITMNHHSLILNLKFNWLLYWVSEVNFQVMITDWLVLFGFYFLIRICGNVKINNSDWIGMFLTSCITGLIFNLFFKHLLLGVSGMWGYLLILSVQTLSSPYFKKISNMFKFSYFFILGLILITMFGGFNYTFLVHLVSLLVGIIIFIIRGEYNVRKKSTL